MPQMQARFRPATDDGYCNANNIPEVLGVTGAFAGAALIAVILRMYVRTIMLKFIGPDDYFMIAAMLMAIGTFICFVGETKYGLGRHMTCILPSDLEMLSKWLYFHSLWVMFGVVFVKVSIAFFLLRLAPIALWRRFLWGAVGESYSGIHRRSMY